MKVRVFDSIAQAAEGALEYLAGPRIAVSGGGTFADLFPRWAPAVRRSVQAGRNLKFFPVDERMVPYEDGDCNWRVCCERLLIPAGLAAQKAHHAVSAAQYSALLQREFADGPVAFDAILLGTGEDGHTASLFPGSASLADRHSTVLEITGPKPPPRRVTLAFKPIWECKVLVAFIFGSGKADIVKRLRAGDGTLPIVQALAGHGNAVLMLDKAAAGT